MALPALAALQPADVVVARPIAGLFTDTIQGDVVPLEPGARGVLRAAARLRRKRYDRGVIFPASFSSAALFRLARVKRRRGVDSDGRGPLLSERVDPAALAGLHRTAAFWLIGTGEWIDEPPAPRLAVTADARARWAVLAPPAESGRRTVGLIPGGAAPSRRWDPERFAETAAALAAAGDRVIVFGGPAERALTAAVAGASALDLGGRTDLPLLAAGLAACDLVISNDTGPLHLAAAVGAPTVSLWGAGDPGITRPLGAAHVLLRRPDLPCVPCVKNHCPRSGVGYLLPDAVRECIRLIPPSEVLHAAGRQG